MKVFASILIVAALGFLVYFSVKNIKSIVRSIKNMRAKKKSSATNTEKNTSLVKEDNEK